MEGGQGYVGVGWDHFRSGVYGVDTLWRVHGKCNLNEFKLYTVQYIMNNPPENYSFGYLCLRLFWTFLAIAKYVCRFRKA